MKFALLVIQYDITLGIYSYYDITLRVCSYMSCLKTKGIEFLPQQEESHPSIRRE